MTRTVDERSATVWWYAVVDAAAANGALSRLGDPALRCVTVGPLGLIVSSQQAAVSPGVTVAGDGVDHELAAAAVHHDEVVSGLAALVPALVPIRFGTLADYQELSSLDQASVDRCRALLDRVRDCQEWGLRLMAVGAEPAPDGEDAASGAAYLEAVRDRHRARREAATARDAVITNLQRSLALLSDQVAQLSGRRPGQLASLAYLVRRERAGEFHESVRAARDELHACGIEAVVTGPWAPYSFTDAGPSA